MPEETGQSERPAAYVNSRHVSTQLHPQTLRIRAKFYLFECAAPSCGTYREI